MLTSVLRVMIKYLGAGSRTEFLEVVESFYQPRDLSGDRHND